MNRRMRELREEKDNVHIHIFCFDDYGFWKVIKIIGESSMGDNTCSTYIGDSSNSVSFVGDRGLDLYCPADFSHCWCDCFD